MRQVERLETLMLKQKTHTDAKAVRVDQQTRTAQQRLADKSFSDFMRQHNRAVKKGA